MIQFTKMEGLGNDFVVVDERVHVNAPLVRALCDRHLGVGADGVLRVSSENEAVRMDYWNADGGVAEMCGNGLRCVALFAYENGMETSKTFVVMTALGERRVEVGDEVRVEIGPAEVGEPQSWEGETFYAASVGNPHLVGFGGNPDEIDVPKIGRALEQATPGGVNVGFAQATSGGIKLRVWERGVGETLACGSGMVAAAAVGRRLGLNGAIVTMSVRGGQALVELDGDTTWLTGPARIVFRGEFS